MASVAVGIDLGTTNSVVALSQGGRARVLAAPADSIPLIPSVVSFHPNGQTIVGAAARTRRPIDPTNTVFSVKRLLGRPFHSEEVRRAATRFAFELREGPDAAILVHTRAGDLSLPEISAFVLREIRRVGEAALGETVDRAVVTVPANFNELQRTATKVAGRIADLDVIRILNEPTAAALAYGYGRGTRERLAVYDFGGGTFDVTLLELSGNVFEVLATAGDTFLGGDDIDLLITENLTDALLRAHRIDARQDHRAFELLRAAAEQAKIDLSTADVATIRVPEVGYGVGGGALEFKTKITRAELEKVSGALVARTFEVCSEALKLSGLRPQDFQSVILVGGSTRMPAVRTRVAAFFGRDPLMTIPPEHVVGMGAAVLAEALSGARRPRSQAPPAVTATSRPPAGVPGSMRPITTPGSRVQTAPGPAVTTSNMRANTLLAGGPPPPRTGPTSPMGFAPLAPRVDEETTAKEVPPSPAPPGARRANTNPGLSPVKPGISQPRPGDLSWSADTRSKPPSALDELDEPDAHPAGISTPGTNLGAAITDDDEFERPTQVNVPVSQRPAATPTGPAPAVRPKFTPPPAAPQSFDQPTRPRGRVVIGVGDNEPTNPRQQIPAPAVIAAMMADEATAPRAKPTPSPVAREAPPAPPAPPEPPPFVRNVGTTTAKMAAAVPPPPPPIEAPPVAPSGPKLTESFLGFNAIQPPTSGGALAANPYAPAAPFGASSFGDAPPAGGAAEASQPAPGFAPSAPFGPPSPAFGAQPRAHPPAPASASPPPALASPPSLVPPLLLDVTPFSLSIETVGGLCEVVIPRNATIPVEQTREFATSYDRQDLVRIRIAQGESRKIAQNQLLGELELSGITPAPRGEAKVSVTFELDADGTLQVRAVEAGTGRQTTTRVVLLTMPSAADLASAQQRQRN